MTIPQIIHATFEDGLLRPEEALNLPPHTRVKLIVEPADTFRPPTEEEFDEFERDIDANSVTSHEPLLTRDELHDRR